MDKTVPQCTCNDLGIPDDICQLAHHIGMDMKELVRLGILHSREALRDILQSAVNCLNRRGS